MAEARIIAVVAQKGGAGKTTVSMCLAGTLAGRGHRVAVIDMDPQQTAGRWCKSAPDACPFPATVMGWHHFELAVGREVRKVIENYDFIVVDCPPSVASDVPKAVLAFADVAVVPTRPSGPDIWATAAMANLLRDVRILRGDELPGLLVPTQVVERTGVAKAALKQMRADSVIPTSETMLVNRTAYQQAAIFGLALEDLDEKQFPGAGAAVREVSSLADEVIALIEEGAADDDATSARTA